MTVQRAALYARISEAEAGVDKPANQLAELRALAAASGYTVAAEFTDDDLSAFEGRTERPGFIRLVTAIKDGGIDVVMATEPQRFTRGSAEELEALHLACAQAGAIIHTRAAGVQDPATPMTRAFMRIADTVAWLEVATIKERQAARYRSDRSKGLPPRGLRAVGWEPDLIPLDARKATELGIEVIDSDPGYQPVREAEAVIIREAVRMVVRDGASLSAVTRYLNESGLKTDSMGRERQIRGAAKGIKKFAASAWTVTTTRQLLVRDRNAGLIDGSPSRIEPIIPADVLAELKMAMSSKLPQGPKTQSLLGGIMRCSECGESMVSTVSYSQRKGGPRRVYRVYRCRMVGFDKSVRHGTIQEHLADDWMKTAVIGLIGIWRFNLDDEGAPNLGALRVQLGQIRQQIAQQQELAMIPGVDMGPIKGAITSLVTRREAIESEIAAAQAESGSLGELVGARDVEDEHGVTRTMFMSDGFEEAWADWPVDRKRAIIRKLVHRLELSPGRGTDRISLYPYFPRTPEHDALGV